MRPAVSSQLCYVLRLAYKNPADREKILFLAGLAAGQKSSFRTIFPWEFKFTAQTLVFVALTRPKSLRAPEDLTLDMLQRDAAHAHVCGWMTVSLHARERYSYVHMLSTRAAADPSFGGVGAALLRAVEADAAERKLRYVSLFPLPSVRGFYAKGGYLPMHPDLPEMFKPIAGTISPGTVLRKLEARAVDDDKELWDELLSKLSPTDHQRLHARPEMRYEALAIYGEKGDVEDVRRWARKIRSH